MTDRLRFALTWARLLLEDLLAPLGIVRVWTCPECRLPFHDPAESLRHFVWQHHPETLHHLARKET